MNIEFMKFYPIEISGRIVSGTMHIVLTDLGIQIKSIYVTRNAKGNWLFLLPNRKGMVDGKECSYPVVSFHDKQRQHEFMNCLIQQGQSFVESYLKENPHQYKEITSEARKSLHVQKSQPRPKEVHCEKKSVPDTSSHPVKPKNQKSPIANKEWKDPPKRNTFQKKKSFSR